jgi:hypothetical protein
VYVYVCGLVCALGTYSRCSDFDDTAANIAIGSLLKIRARDFPEAYHEWRRLNQEMHSFSRTLKHYLYRPFHSDPELNMIEPQSYYFLHPFLIEMQRNAQKSNRSLKDYGLIVTWLWRQDEAWQTNGERLIPWGVNNVDLSVVANVIYGISLSLVANLMESSDWFDADLRKIYVDNSQLLAYHLRNRRTLLRPDIGLKYYPSTHSHVYFLARTYALLSSVPQHPFPEMAVVRDLLWEALRSTGTDFLLETSINEQNTAYWDGILGQKDTAWLGMQDYNPGDDRIFTTAISTNALLNIWGEPMLAAHEPDADPRNDRDHCLRWRKDTPPTVIHLVMDAVQFLHENILSSKYMKMSVFFSGGLEGLSTMPFSYPSNVMQFFNGSFIPNPPGIRWETVRDAFYKPSFFAGVRGIIPDAQYRKLLQQSWFLDLPVPEDKSDWSASPIPWLFWNSDAITYAHTYAALSKYLSTLYCG